MITEWVWSTGAVSAYKMVVPCNLLVVDEAEYGGQGAEFINYLWVRCSGWHIAGFKTDTVMPSEEDKQIAILLCEARYGASNQGVTE